MSNVDIEARDQISEAYGERIDSVSAGECDGNCFFADRQGKIVCATCGHAAPVLRNRREA